MRKKDLSLLLTITITTDGIIVPICFFNLLRPFSRGLWEKDWQSYG